MNFDLKTTSIPDILLIEPRVFDDERGWFFEAFNEKQICKLLGSKLKFVQDNHSFSKKGVLRGLHYQTEKTQGKLIRVCNGHIYDVVVDLRKSSPTFASWLGFDISAENKRQLWIPPGFAHGFLVLSEGAEILYKTTEYWHPASEQCIVWNDKTLNIHWPNIGSSPILNSKDENGLDFLNSLYFE